MWIPIGNFYFHHHFIIKRGRVGKVYSGGAIIIEDAAFWLSLENGLKWDRTLRTSSQADHSESRFTSRGRCVKIGTWSQVQKTTHPQALSSEAKHNLCFFLRFDYLTSFVNLNFYTIAASPFYFEQLLFEIVFFSKYFHFFPKSCFHLLSRKKRLFFLINYIKPNDTMMAK